MPSPLLPPLPSPANDAVRHLGNLPGSGQSLLIAEQAAAYPSLSLVICDNFEDAARIEAEVRFFAPTLPVLSFPDWETLPFDNFSPHQDIISQRLACLQQMPQLQRAILIVPASTLLHRLPPKSFVHAHSLLLDIGQRVDPQRLRQELTESGYRAVETVYEHGEFAVRGAIIDIFPMGSELPLRIDLFDDEIDTLRTFDPETQRSIERLDRVRLLPAKEFPLNKAGITHFRQSWRERFDVDPRHCAVYQDISNGITPAGIEYYLPLFFDHTTCLFDYLPARTQLFVFPQLQRACDDFWHDCLQRHESRAHDIQRPILTPQELFLPVNELFARLKAYPRSSLSPAPNGRHAQDLPFATLPDLNADARAEQPLQRLQQHLATAPQRTLFCVESAGRREAMLELLARIDLKPSTVTSWSEFVTGDCACAIISAPITDGWQLASPALQLIGEAQLLGQRVLQQRRRQKATDNSDLIFRNLTELQVGAPVVHDQHGVGRYLGMQTLELDGQACEFLTLEYADGAKLYVPVASLHLISRYSGASDSLAPLHKLGSEQWSKARRKAMEQIRDTAAELLDIYARRAARQGRKFDLDELEYRQFAAGFPFEETPDQEQAIEAVIHDLKNPIPMDRLVCGDVGFGKTEVALRAAFIAIQNNQQVAILAPTTLLAQQHYQTFQDRFADWPVRVEVLSRFRSGSEQSVTLKGLNEGKVDIVVGTHKLLSSDIRFKDLGLLIIDEEHRFGVQQKEKLKSLRAQVNILTLTATPIPRTLNLSMAGIRDLSIIATPPARRLSVKTFVRQHDKALIKEAILRELLRGGQVYYLHNEVKTIDNLAAELRQLVPEARIAVGHGQMRERELEQVMGDFYHKRHNLLVCSTIIETGIDIPNANTIIIERADKFGLAQLHQLRGRVGRSHHQAYAYLLTPHRKAMTADAVKRLEAIEAANTLGAGFTLATHDLEIRGAGELLGEQQSGQIEGVGYALYMELLEQAIESIRKGETPSMDKPLNHGAEIDLKLPALIPEAYLPDVHNRLILYKRIASAKNGEDLKELQVEMIDRFGLLPEPVKHLFRITRLKIMAQQLGISRLDAGSESGRIEFAQHTRIDPRVLVKLVQTRPQHYGLEGGNRLKFTLDMHSSEQRFQAVERLLQQLHPEENRAS